MIQGEKRKDKHRRYLELGQLKYIPNQYYMCVPTRLLDVAKEWVEKINPNYGILEYVEDNGGRKWEDCIRTAKKAKFLHKEPITAHQRQEIFCRLCNARTFTLQGRAGHIDLQEEDYAI
jgi:hypothetical protein